MVPAFLHHGPWTLDQGLKNSMLLALAVLCVLGLRYPLKMLPFAVLGNGLESLVAGLHRPSRVAKRRDGCRYAGQCVLHFLRRDFFLSSCRGTTSGAITSPPAATAGGKHHAGGAQICDAPGLCDVCSLAAGRAHDDRGKAGAGFRLACLWLRHYGLGLVLPGGGKFRSWPACAEDLSRPHFARLRGIYVLDRLREPRSNGGAQRYGGAAAIRPLFHVHRFHPDERAHHPQIPDGVWRL